MYCVGGGESRQHLTVTQEGGGEEWTIGEDEIKRVFPTLYTLDTCICNGEITAASRPPNRSLTFLLIFFCRCLSFRMSFSTSDPSALLSLCASLSAERGSADQLQAKINKYVSLHSFLKLLSLTKLLPVKV